ncbi:MULTISPECIES: hypothetical protein [unclassified Mesorhizobium]|uniref:DUF7940 domain-containing protein n=1 Tax=unclassified Mesorhizobium TaxID=325217 RepID=UPI000FD87444|nr:MULTISPECIES: hypothetical protein [unclassified Mesorhizobium]TGT76157.1 hypothetical protein EN809_000590 [Mesorhizobium sp. M2E.F.Ca.ET.166.01.1.1]TGW02272.1 hypothetical protein EN797_000590 [Mesorhizobium sp. M2E.F.Ca.ET.154.01.1.1]
MKTVTQAIAGQLPTPLPHWRLVLLRAWSIRIQAVELLVIGLDITFPYLDGVLPLPRWLFGVVAGCLTIAAIYARMIQQNNLKGTGR